ncbi:MAG TPA: hypothetical protein VJ775_05870 [Sphingomicrobium sp.]|nr:hypothetical protein [Sphingomicrobium sp.]
MVRTDDAALDCGKLSLNDCIELDCLARLSVRPIKDAVRRRDPGRRTVSGVHHLDENSERLFGVLLGGFPNVRRRLVDRASRPACACALTASSHV